MTLDDLLRRFHRQVTLTRTIRLMVLMVFLAGVTAFLAVEDGTTRAWVLGGLIVYLAGWALLVSRSVLTAKEVKAGIVLLSIGRLDEAEVWLRKGMTTFSLSVPGRLIAGERLAMIHFRRGGHENVVRICQELLRQPIRRIRRLWVDTRLLLADSLLIQGHLDEAREAMGPVGQVTLSLEARLRLLPIELRYELAAGLSADAVRDLADKVRLAELMDAKAAALTHALLAEACRREQMSREQQYLTERAHLYHDLGEIVEDMPMIAPVVEAAEANP